MMCEKSLKLDSFYPTDVLGIEEICHQKNQITIWLKSKTRTCECPNCREISENYHGTYVRTVQDLPILGKNVKLYIKAHEYRCNNEDCPVTTIAETYEGFLGYYSRMTARCEDFICTLALESTCEGCARICKELGIKTSGDSVIRLLLKRYGLQDEPVAGDVIGIDDFADGKSHETVAILDGRDGATLREWLKRNKQVKMITRDRASAYAKVIAEELPDAMQIADRFHLHQNLLEAVKHILNHEIPATIKIPHDEAACPDNIRGDTDSNSGKKNADKHCG